jgi:hypothetical protein
LNHGAFGPFEFERVEMICRYPRLVPFGSFAFALFGCYAATQPGKNGAPIALYGVLIILTVSAFLLYQSAYFYRYALSIQTDRIIERAIFSTREYLISGVASIEVSPGKGATFAVITMKDGSRISVPSWVSDFRSFLDTIRAASGMKKRASEPY